MTELLEQAVRSARQLPPAMQDDLARLMLVFAGEPEAPYVLSPEEDESLGLSEAAAARGEFATEAEVRAVWAKHGL
jgi:hypothetical protein